jgi:hypothetical protein
MSMASKVMCGVFGVVGILFTAGTMIPATSGRCKAPKSACINNLRQIDGAKEQWQYEQKIPSGAPAVDSEVEDYIKGGRPKCPQGGIYTFGAAGEAPKCSVAGHTLY